MKTPGFHFRLLITAFVLIGGAVFIMGYLGLGMMRSYVQDRFEERNHFLSGYLARNAELGILINDERMLGRLAEGLKSEPDVVGVEIFDSTGRAILARVEDDTGEYTVSRAEVHTRQVQDERLMSPGLTENEGYSGVIGEVAVYFSLHEVQGLQRSLAWKFGLLSVVVALLSICCFYVISRSLVVPVNRLARIAEKIAGGDRKVRAQPDRIPETRELALAFNSMLDSLDRSSKELEQAYQDMARQRTMAELGRFAMLIAHEVKNPLGIIKSSLDVLKDEAGLDDDHPMVYYIEDEIRRISRLLEDFLAFSRPARPEWQSPDLNQLVQECVHRFEIQEEAGNVELVLSADPGTAVTRADPDLLAKAVYNLLKNAAEANDWTGKIFVRTETKNSGWFLEVEDQGPGIPYSMEEHIFEPFFTTKSRGSGLGLAFASYVADIHGGRLEGHNKTDPGAVFRLLMEPANVPCEHAAGDNTCGWADPEPRE